jgi:hypothetical protein
MQKILEFRSSSKAWILSRNSPKVSAFGSLLAIDILLSMPSCFSGEGGNSAPFVLCERFGTCHASDSATKPTQCNGVRVFPVPAFFERLPVQLLTSRLFYNPSSRYREIPLRA